MGKNTPGSQGDTMQQQKDKVSRTFGPVPNLEAMVSADWWKKIFNAVYLKTDADVVDDQGITRREIDFFSQVARLRLEDRILDLSCGQGRHTMELARRGFHNLDGLDRSRYLIQKAKSQARKECLVPRFREGDARELPYTPDTFDAVMILGNSFGYFETIDDDFKVLKEVHKVLKPWGRIIVDIADGNYIRENFQPRSWEWIDKKYFVCRERSLSLDKQRLISREVVTHVDKGVIADQFYAERLYTQESLYHILEHAGFNDIVSHGQMITDSMRNQDLGMMERRIILTATVRKEWTPLKKKKSLKKNITVLLGDPSKSDPLKPSMIWDDDDIYTIDQMKNALLELGEYNCTFINKHDSLYQELVKQKQGIDLVFNLCDEGFNNDARKELHVPSLLEMLDIPYTGGGPQCLAYCYDKSLVRGIAKEMGIPVPEAFIIKPEDSTYELSVSFPVIAKPNFGDSSFGITQGSVANSAEELLNAITNIRENSGYQKPILVEEFLPGKDLSIGIIGNVPDSYTVLPLIEEDYSKLPSDLPRLCGYEAKWLPDSPYWNITSIQAELPESVEKQIISCSLMLFDRLECRDYCRFDWRLNGAGEPKLLEVNPNPGWCWDGHLAKMSKFYGWSYADMLRAILHAAEHRVFKNGHKLAEEVVDKDGGCV